MIAMTSCAKAEVVALMMLELTPIVSIPFLMRFHVQFPERHQTGCQLCKARQPNLSIVPARTLQEPVSRPCSATLLQHLPFIPPHCCRFIPACLLLEPQQGFSCIHPSFISVPISLHLDPLWSAAVFHWALQGNASVLRHQTCCRLSLRFGTNM